MRIRTGLMATAVLALGGFACTQSPQDEIVIQQILQSPARAEPAIQTSRNASRTDSIADTTRPRATALTGPSLPSAVYADSLVTVDSPGPAADGAAAEVPSAGPATTATTRSTTQPSAERSPEPMSVGNSRTAGTAPATQPANIGRVLVTSDMIPNLHEIAPELGAVTHTIGQEQIQNVPGGSNASFQQVLERLPGVVPDSFGQEHVRGEHANLTYRVNGVLLPEPLNGFGQELDTRLIDNVSLITGSLPAQFGFHTAGIVDVTTKSGDTLNHNEISLYGGSNDTFNPSLQLGGTTGKLDYFVTASYNHNDLGLENPTASHRAIHDYTDQEKMFAYLSYRIDDTSRLSILLNASYADFQIPNTPGLAPAFTLAGSNFHDSSKLDENQNEQEYYAVVAYQKSLGALNYQLAGFVRYGRLDFMADHTGDLIFQGVAGDVVNSFVTSGVQFDASYKVNEKHTLRGGFIADYTAERLDTTTDVFSVDASGAQTSFTPASIIDNTGNHATEAGIYLQDEWRLTKKLTLNYGLRYDVFDSNFDTEEQLSPRVNLVYKIDDPTTFHIGYSRYFVPPPVQNVTTATINKFVGTTNEPPNFTADHPRVEKSNYFDIGASRQMTKEWQIGLDGFYKMAKNLVDLGQFGAPIILSPFNYNTAKVYGIELSNTYRNGPFSAFANVSWVETSAHDIISQQFLIDNDELAYIHNHDVHLDHEAEYSVSAGAAYAWTNDRVYIDMIYSSGLRSGFANTDALPHYYPVNIGYEHVFRPSGPGGNPLRLRFDIINVFDERFVIRDGSGIGVGAPQFGQRRSFMIGLAYEF